jgi:hypothetical protein
MRNKSKMNSTWAFKHLVEHTLLVRIATDTNTNQTTPARPANRGNTRFSIDKDTKKENHLPFQPPALPPSPAEETVVTWRELQASLLDQRFKIRQLFEIQKVSNPSNFQKFGKN